MKKNEKTLMIENGNDEFGAILNCAVRYCIGRQTYMPKLVTDWIMSNCYHKLNKRTLTVMLRDINTSDNLGADCDVMIWMQFTHWIGQQLKALEGENNAAN